MGRLKRLIKVIEQFRKDGGKSISWVQFIIRLAHWVIILREDLTTFFTFKIYRKENKISTLLPYRKFFSINNKLNPFYYRCLLEDKFAFDRYMTSFGFPLAEMIGLVENGQIQWMNDGRKESIDNLGSYSMDCFFKMLTRWGGQNVHKLEIQGELCRIDNSPGSLEEFKKLVSDDVYVLQKRVTQHMELDRLNPFCVNTIRMVTIHDGNFAYNFLNFMRMGADKSIVDNLSMGGIGCGIHDDGSLFETGLYEYGSITHHPSSNVAFKGFVIPYFKQAQDLVREMHQSFHCFFLIGWDIAITESGPVVIEGNPVGELNFEQSIFGGIQAQFMEYARSYEKNRKDLLNDRIKHNKG